MYSVIARSIVYSERYPTSSLIRVLSMQALGPVLWAVSPLQLDLHTRSLSQANGWSPCVDVR